MFPFGDKLLLYLTFSASGSELPCEPHIDDKAFYKKLSSALSASDSELPCCDAYLLPNKEPLQPQIQPLGTGPPSAKAFLST